MDDAIFGAEDGLKNTKLSLTLEQGVLRQLDEWRNSHGGGALREEAALRLIKSGLQQFGESDVLISDGEKIIMTMLRDIYPGRSVQNRSIDPDFVLEALARGHHWGIAWKYPEVFGSGQVNEQLVIEVSNILDMWKILESEYNGLPDQEKAQIVAELGPVGKSVMFSGFDGNHEIVQYGIVRFLMNEMNRYHWFNGRGLNSHSPRLDGYRRMLKAFDSLSSIDKLNASMIISVLEKQKNLKYLGG